MKRMFHAALSMALVALVSGAVPSPADAAGSRGRARTSVNRSGGGGDRGNVNRGANVNRSADVNRNTNVNRNANVNRNTNVNRNANVNRNIDVDRDLDIDRDIDVDYRGGCCYGGVAAGVTAAAIATTAAVVTSAVIGSTVATVPASCTTVIVDGLSYRQCDNVWYQPQFVGTDTTYVVVNPPQ